MKAPEKVIRAGFYRLESGREPVREWLLDLSASDRNTIGRDIMSVEFAWPCGEPLCKSLTGYPGLYEVRSDISNRGIARVFFYVAGKNMILLHGFVKKSQETPQRELKLANRRMKEHKRHG